MTMLVCLDVLQAQIRVVVIMHVILLAEMVAMLSLATVRVSSVSHVSELAKIGMPMLPLASVRVSVNRHVLMLEIVMGQILAMLTLATARALAMLRVDNLELEVMVVLPLALTLATLVMHVLMLEDPVAGLPLAATHATLIMRVKRMDTRPEMLDLLAITRATAFMRVPLVTLSLILPLVLDRAMDVRFVSAWKMEILFLTTVATPLVKINVASTVVVKVSFHQLK